MPGGAFHPRTLGSRTPAPRARGARAGITLIEVMLAMAITALIGSAVSGLIYSTCQSTRDQQILRRRNIKADVVTFKLDSALRSSTAVLAAGDDFVVLWRADRGDDKPHWSEIQRIEWDRGGRRLRSYRAPERLTDEVDPPLDPSIDFDRATRLLRGTILLPGETWCQGVTAWQVGPPGASRSTRLLCYTISFEDPAGTATVKSTVALRGQ